MAEERRTRPAGLEPRRARDGDRSARRALPGWPAGGEGISGRATRWGPARAAGRTRSSSGAGASAALSLVGVVLPAWLAWCSWELLSHARLVRSRGAVAGGARGPARSGLRAPAGGVPQLCEGVVIRVEDFPDDETLRDGLRATSICSASSAASASRRARHAADRAVPQHGLALPPPDPGLLGRARGDASAISSPTCWSRDRPPFRPLRRGHGGDRGGVRWSVAVAGRGCGQGGRLPRGGRVRLPVVDAIPPRRG